MPSSKRNARAQSAVAGTTASAPGKVILFGEHAVVFGEPAISAAISMRTVVTATPSDSSTMNGAPLREDAGSYPFHALRITGSGAHSLTVRSDIPPGAGLGSSAALTVAVVGALRNEYSRAAVAETAFSVELAAQGRASPVDTSTSTHGSGVYVDQKEGDNLLWSIAKGDVRWHIHHLDVPPLSIVIGFTGRGAPTGPLVANVHRLYAKFEVARNAIREIGNVSAEARKKLRAGDVVGLGGLMDLNQKLLSIIGVSSPEIERLLDAVRPFSYGAKLTGAGGGGSIISLTERPERVSDAIRRRGFTPFECTIGEEGLRSGNAEG